MKRLLDQRSPVQRWEISAFCKWLEVSLKVLNKVFLLLSFKKFHNVPHSSKEIFKTSWRTTKAKKGNDGNNFPYKLSYSEPLKRIYCLYEISSFVKFPETQRCNSRNFITKFHGNFEREFHMKFPIPTPVTKVLKFQIH